MGIKNLHRIDKTKIEIPKDFKPGMRTNGIIYVDETLEKELDARSIEIGRAHV